jgi:hypothetical protein
LSGGLLLVHNIGRVWLQKLRRITQIYAPASSSLPVPGLRSIKVMRDKLSRKLFVVARVYEECWIEKGWWPMKNSNDSLFGFALAVVALVALLTVSHSWERSVSPLTVTNSKVSELGLRVSMQR